MLTHPSPTHSLFFSFLCPLYPKPSYSQRTFILGTLSLSNVSWTQLSPSVSHSDPPTVEPVYMEMRQGLGRPVVMTCRVLRAHPSRVLRFEWLLSNRLLHAGAFDAQRDETEYTIRSLNRDGWGEYTCNVINEAGAGKCTFQVTGKESTSFQSFSWNYRVPPAPFATLTFYSYREIVFHWYESSFWLQNITQPCLTWTNTTDWVYALLFVFSVFFIFNVTKKKLLGWWLTDVVWWKVTPSWIMSLEEVAGL